MQAKKQKQVSNRRKHAPPFVFENLSAAGNVKGYLNNTGNYRTEQTYRYDGLYQLTYAKGVSDNGQAGFRAQYEQTFQFDNKGLGNLMRKTSATNNSDARLLGEMLDYNLDYVYSKDYAHRAEKIGPNYYQYDANGNVTAEQEGQFAVNTPGSREIIDLGNGVTMTDSGWGQEETGLTGGTTRPAYRRDYTWNERNLLQQSRDNRYVVEYSYGQDGQRAGKYSVTADGGHPAETLYFNKMWTWRYDGLVTDRTGRNSKHIYLDDTRIVTKIGRADGSFTGEEAIKQYYYHADHLGSAQLITDADGLEYERIEYTPYGELWIEKASIASNIDIPYRFTGKEKDEETGLYYYGARYLDAKTSRWLSTDPAIGEYIPGAPINDEVKKQNGNLPGMGGVFNTINSHLYHYAGNNPVKYTVPDGKKLEIVVSKSKGTMTVTYTTRNRDYPFLRYGLRQSITLKFTNSVATVSPNASLQDSIGGKTKPTEVANGTYNIIGPGTVSVGAGNDKNGKYGGENQSLVLDITQMLPDAGGALDDNGNIKMYADKGYMVHITPYMTTNGCPGLHYDANDPKSKQAVENQAKVLVNMFNESKKMAGDLQETTITFRD
ncbi:hypothetical protein FACS189485_15710 [Spirochaetia bacterium]|nr:hypothetical protein FACS189485_15710 [Spirochaetia bacterium]